MLGEREHGAARRAQSAERTQAMDGLRNPTASPPAARKAAFYVTGGEGG